MESIKNLSIPEIPRDLLTKILREEVIVFVGNGVSMLAGIPSWKDLALKYLEDWRSRGSISYDAFEKLKREKIDPLELLTICSGFIGIDKVKEQLKDKLTEGLTEKNIEDVLRIYGYIRDLKTGYVTTNYDDFLETAQLTKDELSIKESSYYKTYDNISLNRVNLEDNLDNPTDKIVYLHGKAYAKGKTELVFENKIILTLEDYLEHYKDIEKGQNGKSFLKRVFNKTFLFIGLGLKEFEIIQHIQKPSGSTNHYILLGISDYEECIQEEYEKYYKILNIRPIFYNMSSKGYHQLEDVLKDWSYRVRSERIKNYENMRKTEKDEDNLIKILGSKYGTFR